MKRGMPRMGRAGAVALAALVVSISGQPIPEAQAEELGTGAAEAVTGAPFVKDVPPGQIILNPEPDDAGRSAAQEAAQEAYEALAAMEPAAGGDAAGPSGSAGVATGCPESEGWQVVVVRGSAREETVRGRLIAVTPQGC